MSVTPDDIRSITIRFIEDGRVDYISLAQVIGKVESLSGDEGDVLEVIRYWVSEDLFWPVSGLTQEAKEEVPWEASNEAIDKKIEQLSDEGEVFVPWKGSVRDLMQKFELLVRGHRQTDLREKQYGIWFALTELGEEVRSKDDLPRLHID